MAHLRRTVTLILLVFAALVTSPAQARQNAPITVMSSEATPDFPNQITFALNATSSAADIRQVELLYGATRTNALRIVDLPVTAGPTVALSHRLDTQVNYYPPGTEITYRWVIHDAAGNTQESEPQRVVYHDQRFPWSERTARNVTVYWYEGGNAFGDDLMATVDRALTNLRAELGVELAKPVRIYVYATLEDLRTALQSNSVEWVGGENRPDLGIIVAAISAGDNAEMRRIIPHELSHQVLHQAIENPYGGTPLWFDEGLAVHNQEVRDSTFDQMVTQAAQENRLIPLEALSSNFPADPNQARLSYAQSRDMVEHINDTYGDAKLKALVAAFAAATPVNEAVQQVLGRSIDDLDAEWRKEQPKPSGPAPDRAGPQEAPADRFSDPPVLPVGVQPPVGAQPPVSAARPPATPDDQPPAFISWLESLPAWATLSAAAVCCTTGILLVGTVLLVGLRMIGVDKRV